MEGGFVSATACPASRCAQIWQTGQAPPWTVGGHARRTLDLTWLAAAVLPMQKTSAGSAPTPAPTTAAVDTAPPSVSSVKVAVVTCPVAACSRHATTASPSRPVCEVGASWGGGDVCASLMGARAAAARGGQTRRTGGGSARAPAPPTHLGQSATQRLRKPAPRAF